MGWEDEGTRARGDGGITPKGCCEVDAEHHKGDKELGSTSGRGSGGSDMLGVNRTLDLHVGSIA